MDTAIAFIQEYSWVSYRLRNMSTLSMSSDSSKDTHSCGRNRVERISYALESMLKRINNIALNFRLPVSLTNKPVVPPTVHCFIIERGGLLGNGQDCHRLLATSTNRGHIK